jgi:hypothetical protein
MGQFVGYTFFIEYNPPFLHKPGYRRVYPYRPVSFTQRGL